MRYTRSQFGDSGPAGLGEEFVTYWRATGNAHLRRVLVESAWHYRHHPFVGDTLRARQRGAPAAIIAQAWTAQHRLHRPYARFAARGKPKQHIVTAIARELTGFVWAALTHNTDRPTVERRTLASSMR